MTTALHQLIKENRMARALADDYHKRKEEELKEKDGNRVDDDVIKVKYASGLYQISIMLREYEILVETESEIYKRDHAPTNISVFFSGMEVTDHFVKKAHSAERINPTGTNLAKIMALVIKKDNEETGGE